MKAPSRMRKHQEGCGLLQTNTALFLELWHDMNLGDITKNYVRYSSPYYPPLQITLTIVELS